MHRKRKLLFLGIAVGLLAGGLVFWFKDRSGPAVRVVIRLSVQPPDKAGYVLAQANSARFKYVLGKVAGTKPYLAQKFELEAAPDAGRLEGSIGVQNQEEAKKWTGAFMDALQGFCGPQVRITLEEQKIR